MSKPYHVRVAVSQYGEHFRAELFTEDLGDTEGDLIAAKWSVLDEWLPWLQAGGAGLAPDDARQMGKELFVNLLGGPENGSKWKEVLTRAEQDSRPIRLLIDAASEQIRNLPFGLLCEPYNNYYLFRRRKGRPPIRFVRIIRRCTPRRLNLGRRPLRILLAAADPNDIDIPKFDAPARLCELVRDLANSHTFYLCTSDGFRPLDDLIREPVEEWRPELFRPFTRTTRNALQSALEQGSFDVLHLIAHGRGGDTLVLCTHEGKADPVTAGELGEWCRGNLQMAFLQVCKASNTGDQGGFGGIAQQLLNPEYGDLAAVVASAYPLDAGRTVPAAIAFYRAIANQLDLDEAVDRNSSEADFTWAFLEVWVRPGALGQIEARGAFQFASPYRGLARFEESDADIFCGREAEVEELLKLLGDEPVVTIVGDSGSGKSSLLRAGLAHGVRQRGLRGRGGWRVITLTPGEHPVDTLLSRVLIDEGAQVRSNRDQETAETLGEKLESTCSPDRPLLILFDQFEEIFTLCKDEHERQTVTAALARVVRYNGEHFRLVLAIRTEYVTRVALLPGLSELVKRPWLLKPPTEDKIREIIERPATHHGYNFQNALADSKPEHQQGLLERILEDPLLIARSSDSVDDTSKTNTRSAAPLPLLEFALERLWLRAIERGSQEFTHDDYDKLGGLGGAIAKHAEDAFENLVARKDLGPNPQAMMEKIITGVVSSQKTSRPRRRGDLETESGNPEEARRLIDHLVGERLLTLRGPVAHTSEPQVELAHEILIANWNRLKIWLEQGADTRAFIQEFQDDAERWNTGTPGNPLPRNPDTLPRVERAKWYLDGLEKLSIPLTDAQLDFKEELVELRTKDEQDKKQLRKALEAATVRTVQLYVRNGTQNIKDGYLWGAWVWFAEALRLDTDNPQQEEAHRIRLAAIQRELPRLSYTWFHDEPARYVTFSPDGKLLLTFHSRPWRGPSSILLWNLETRELVADIPVEGIRSNQIAFNFNGQRILAIAYRNSPRPGEQRTIFQSWMSTTGETDSLIEASEGEEIVGLDSSGRRILTLNSENQLKVWDLMAEEHLITSWEISSSPQQAILSPDASYVIAAIDKEVWIRPVGKDGETLPLLHDEYVDQVAVSPNGKYLITSTGSKAFIWNLADQHQGAVHLPHGRIIEEIAFNPDGRHLLTTIQLEDKNFETRVWDMPTGKQQGATILHEEVAAKWEFELAPGRSAGSMPMIPMSTINPFSRRAAFSPDGRRIVTISEAKNAARIWDWRSGEALTPPLNHFDQPIEAVAFSPDGCYLATCARDGTTRFWEVALPQFDALPVLHDYHVDYVTFSPDGRRIAFACHDGAVEVWDFAEHKRVLRLLGHEEVVLFVKFSTDGRFLATGDINGRARVWQAQSGEPMTPFLEHIHWVEDAFFSQDNRFLLTLSRGSNARVWDIEAGSPLTAPLHHPGKIKFGTFSPDQRYVLTVGGDSDGKEGQAILWDISKGEPVFSPLRQSDRVDHATFDANGSQIWTYSGNEFARWDSRTGHAARTPVTNNSYFRKFLSCSQDGMRVLTASYDCKQALVVDTVTGDPLTPQMDHETAIDSATFSLNRKRLLTISGKEVRIWDAETGELLSPPLKYQVRIGHAAFNADASRVVLASSERADGYPYASNAVFVRFLREDLSPVEAIVMYGQICSQHQVDRAGGFVSLDFEAFRDAWNRLREKYPKILELKGRDVMWHKQQAQASGSERFGREFHLEQLVAKLPDDPWIYLMRARYFEQEGRHEEAIENYSKAIDLGSGDQQVFKARGLQYIKAGQWQQAMDDLAKALNAGEAQEWHRYAIVTVLAGNKAEYRRTCRQMIERLEHLDEEPDPIRRWNNLSYLAWSCVFAPQALDDWASLIRAVQGYLSESDVPDQRMPENAALLAGAVLCRSGEYEAAIAQLEKTSYHPMDWLFLSIAHFQSGNEGKAKEYLSQASTLLDQTLRSDATDRTGRWPWEEQSKVEIIEGEARILLGGLFAE